MPYIKKEIRQPIKDGDYLPMTAGELNFQLTACILNYLQGGNESYQSYNDCLGALEGAKLELYRRRIADYENAKIIENGDVY